ncbi:unnamed protein product, partial [Closterium sp. NIES-54]
ATQRSSQGYTFSLGSGPVSWRSTRSSSVLGSNCEAEIYTGAMAAQKLRWLTYLLTDLGERPLSPPFLFSYLVVVDLVVGVTGPVRLVCPLSVGVVIICAILAAMYALSTSDEGDCYLCVPPDLGIEAAALGAGETAALGASPTSEVAGAGAAGAGGATGAGAPAGSPGAVPAGSGGAPRPRPYFVPLLEQVLGLPPSPGPAPPFECPQPVQSQSLLQPVSPLPAPSPYTGPTGGLAERRAPASRPASPARPACTSKGAMAAQELRWLTYLLTDLGEQPRSPPVLYVDNKAMLALCREHRMEHRMKHIALCYFLARELQQRGQLRLAYVASEANTADIFTKALAPGDHQRFCTLLGLVPTWPHLLTS